MLHVPHPYLVSLSFYTVPIINFPLALLPFNVDRTPVYYTQQHAQFAEVCTLVLFLCFTIHTLMSLLTYTSH